MLVHAWHAYQWVYISVVIHATDTEVVVLAFAMASVGSAVVSCGWHMDMGQSLGMLLHPHTIATHIGPERSWGLLFMHAVSGCDTVSSYLGSVRRLCGTYGI